MKRMDISEKSVGKFHISSAMNHETLDRGRGRCLLYDDLVLFPVVRFPTGFSRFRVLKYSTKESFRTSQAVAP